MCSDTERPQQPIPEAPLLILSRMPNWLLKKGTGTSPNTVFGPARGLRLGASPFSNGLLGLALREVSRPGGQQDWGSGPEHLTSAEPGRLDEVLPRADTPSDEPPASGSRSLEGP